MRTTRKVVLRRLGIIGLVLVGVGVLVALNWDALSRKLGESLDAQSKSARATLFRMGELMSLGAALNAEYGAETDVAYNTDTGERILSITFSDYQLPEEGTAKDHAREIGVFAIGKTTKFEQIDAVRVLFQTSDRNGLGETVSNSGSYSFALDELMSAQPQAEPAEPGGTD